MDTYPESELIVTKAVHATTDGYYIKSPDRVRKHKFYYDLRTLNPDAMKNWTVIPKYWAYGFWLDKSCSSIVKVVWNGEKDLSDAVIDAAPSVNCYGRFVAYSPYHTYYIKNAINTRIYICHTNDVREHEKIESYVTKALTLMPHMLEFDA